MILLEQFCKRRAGLTRRSRANKFASQRSLQAGLACYRLGSAASGVAAAVGATAAAAQMHATSTTRSLTS